MSCYNPASGSCVGSPTSRAQTNPQAGVWEVSVEARRTSDTANAPYIPDGFDPGRDSVAQPDTIASATIATPVARSYTLTNDFGTFTGRAVGSTLGSARIDTPTIAPGASQQRSMVVSAAPSGSTTFNYVDVFTNPAAGSVSVTASDAVRPAGSQWTVPGTVTANAAPAAGRVLLGTVQVRTDSNVLVGTGDVVVQSVTP